MINGCRQPDLFAQLRLTDFFLVFYPKYVNYYNSHRFMDLRRGLAGASLRGIHPARRRADKTVQVENLCQSF
jgi:hypothetical protein